MNFFIKFSIFVFVVVCFLQFRYCYIDRETVSPRTGTYKIPFMPAYASTSKIRTVIKGYADCEVCINITSLTNEPLSTYVANDTLIFPKRCQRILLPGKIDTVFVQEWYYSPGIFIIHSSGCSTKSELYVNYSFAHFFW